MLCGLYILFEIEIFVKFGMFKLMNVSKLFKVMFMLCLVFFVFFLRGNFRIVEIEFGLVISGKNNYVFS